MCSHNSHSELSQHFPTNPIHEEPHSLKKTYKSLSYISYSHYCLTCFLKTHLMINLTFPTLLFFPFQQCSSLSCISYQFFFYSDFSQIHYRCPHCRIFRMFSFSWRVFLWWLNQSFFLSNFYVQHKF